MSKYYFLKSTEKKVPNQPSENSVLGLVIKDYSNPFKEPNFTIIRQDAIRLKRNRKDTEIIAQGFLADIFIHLPKEVVDYGEQFKFVIDGFTITVVPITVSAGGNKYYLGAQLEPPDGEVKIVESIQYKKLKFMYDHGIFTFLTEEEYKLFQKKFIASKAE